MKKLFSILIGFLVICGVAGATAVAGQYDQSVYNAQRELKQRGYSPGPADGLMGKQTKDAIRKFQQAQGLPATGSLDEKTINLLNAGPSNEKSPTPEKNVGKTSAKSADDTNRILKAQQYLQQLGYKPGTPDGMAGKKTTTAVKKFQQDHGLTVTGIINDLVLKEMKALLEPTEKSTPQKASGPKGPGEGPGH